MQNKSPVRLLHAFSTFSLGGAQARFVKLARALSPDFHHIITAMDSCFDAAEHLKGLDNFELYRIDSKRGRNLNNIPQCISALRDIRPDRLVTYNFGSIEWAFANAVAQLPHLHVEDGFGPEEAEKRLLRRSLLRAVAFRLSRTSLITISTAISEIAVKEWFLPSTRVQLIPNGIEAHSFLLASQRARNSTFASGSEIVIGTVAGLRPEKRIDRLLNAVALLPKDFETVLVIAGTGPMRRSLETLAKDLGLGSRTLFLGQRDDIEKLYSEFDIFALSSDTEQHPLAVLEAMAAGLPIASTAVGDIRNMVCNPNQRWLCERDADALSTVLHQIIEQRELWHRVGNENAKIARERFSAEKMFVPWERAFAGTKTEQCKE